MLYYYLFCAIASILIICIFLIKSGSRYNPYYSFGYILSVVSNLGFLAAYLAKSTETFILATKIFYIGGSFFPMILFFILAEVCTIDIPRTVKLSLWVICVLLYMMILSIGYYPIYYKSIELVYVEGVRHVIKTYGPVHNVYYVSVCLYFIGVLGIMVYALARKKNVSRKLIFLICISVCAGTMGYLLTPILKINIELLPVIYVSSEIVLLLLENQVCISNVQNDITKDFATDTIFGYIVFDRRLRFCGISSVALKFFPEFKNVTAESRLDENNPFFNKLLYLLSSSDEQEFYRNLQKGDSFFKLHIKRISTRRKFSGWVIEVADDTEQQHYTTLLKNFNEELSSAIKEKAANINAIQQKIILGMADVVENRDNNTGGHVKRTSDTISIIINAYKKNTDKFFPRHYFSDIIRAAPLHDLGKIAVEDRILRKNGRFTEDEYEIMKIHPEKSAQIIDRIFKDVVEEHFYTVARNVANYHHEKWNGTGYPEGLKGEEIPLEARLMAIADVYDALVSKRCYKEAMSHETAFNIIIESMGSHFDPGLEAVFREAYPKLVEYYYTADNL